MSHTPPTITSEATMAKQATRRIPVYLTPDQFEAAQEARELSSYKSASDWIRDLIARECERLSVEWPGDVQWGGARTPKKEGVEEIEGKTLDK